MGREIQFFVTTKETCQLRNVYFKCRHISRGGRQLKNVPIEINLRLSFRRKYFCKIKIFLCKIYFPFDYLYVI